MREKELLKIVLQGDFNVIKISKNEEGFYILKQMCACQIPSWCIIEKSSKLSDIEFCISIMRHSSKYILNASERIKVSDLINCRKRSIPTHSERLNPPTIIAKMALKSA